VFRSLNSSAGPSSGAKQSGGYGLQSLHAANGNDNYTSTNKYTSKVSSNRRQVVEDSESQKDMITNGIMINTEVDLEEEYRHGSFDSPKKSPTVHEAEV